MLQAKYKRKSSSRIMAASVALVTVLIAAVFPAASGVFAAGGYITTPRDTQMPPESLVPAVTDVSAYTELYATDNFTFYFRDDRDVMAIKDNNTGYVWKTGIDIEFNKNIDDAVDAATTPEEKLAAAVPIEDRLNTTFTAFANSLLTIEYYDESQNIKMVSSAPYRNGTSELSVVGGDPSHLLLDVDFSEVDINVKMHIYLSDSGISYEIKNADVTGSDTNILAAFIITPFLGAAGGQKIHYNPVTSDYDIEVPNPIVPGYVFVPDGSGALMRFSDNTVSLKAYKTSVYGEDFAQNPYYQSGDNGMVPFKQTLMPVFGIAHGNNQAAFVAYATSGAEYLEFQVTPEENLTFYTFAYPRFVVNRLYHQVYNKKGDGYFTVMAQPNKFDVAIAYEFLHGDGSDGSPSADYVGMAQKYREYLISSGKLTEKSYDYTSTPIRLDFIMSDIKKGVLGYKDIITTTVDDVRDILNDVSSNGIENVNVGLLGFQKGGITSGKPWNTRFTSKIGTKREFSKLINDFNDIGMDISFTQDYSSVNSLQMNLLRNWTIHVNKWGLKRYIGMPDIQPVSEISFADPVRSASWLSKQTAKFGKLGVESVTIEGISDRLFSQYGRNPHTRIENAAILNEAFAKVNDDYMVNAVSPNSYLWMNVDRFLEAPVFSTQYITETDTVPFLQMVLNGTMEVYAPYSNFSFYTEKDVLRMIDYNVYPSFILTKEAAYNLSSTNSAEFYSTEYTLYASIIKRVYDRINDALHNTIGTTWTSRKLISEGVVVNRYSNGLEILINYTKSTVEYRGIVTKPEDFSVITD